MESFAKRKRDLREVYKRYKAGLLKEDELTAEQRALLKRYYGVKDE